MPEKMLAGVDQLHFAFMTSDDAGGAFYDTPELVYGLNALTESTEVNADSYPADNGVFDTNITWGQTTLTLTLAALSLYLKQRLLGRSLANGRVGFNKNDSVPYVAIGFRYQKTNGHKGYVWWTKGKLQPPETAHSTKATDSTLAGLELSFTFEDRLYDGQRQWEMDEDHPDYSPATVANWFNTVDALADSTPPTVTCNIVDAATGVAVSTDVVFTFSEAIQVAEVNTDNVFVIKADGTAVAGEISIDTDHEIVTFNPAANLTASTAYVAVVGTAIKDLAGNKLASRFVVNFTTA